jgi:hypothetical protein
MNGPDHVVTATGVKPAGVAKEGAEQALIDFNRPNTAINCESANPSQRSPVHGTTFGVVEGGARRLATA